MIDGLSGNGTVDGTSGAPTITLGDNDASGLTFSGVIQNTAGALALSKIGTGTQTLSGANTYTGATTIQGGILSVGTLANGGTSSSIGARQMPPRISCSTAARSNTPAPGSARIACSVSARPPAAPSTLPVPGL